MASSTLFILVGILFLSLIVGIVWLLTLIFKERKIDPSAPYCLNMMSSFDQGCFLGQEVKQTTGKNGRRIIEYLPKDIDPKRAKDVKSIQVIIDKNKIISLPKGTVSRDKNFNIYLPESPSDLHETLKETIFGKAMMFATGLRDLVNLEIDILSEGRLRRDELLKKIGDGEISREFMKFTDELVKDALETAISAKDAKKSSTSTSLVSPKPAHE